MSAPSYCDTVRGVGLLCSPEDGMCDDCSWRHEAALLTKENARLKAFRETANEFKRDSDREIARLKAELVETQLALDVKHAHHKHFYALWLKVVRAVTPDEGPDITDERVAEKVETLRAELEEARKTLQAIGDLVHARAVLAKKAGGT